MTKNTKNTLRGKKKVILPARTWKSVVYHCLTQVLCFYLLCFGIFIHVNGPDQTRFSGVSEPVSSPGSSWCHFSASLKLVFSCWQIYITANVNVLETTHTAHSTQLVLDFSLCEWFCEYFMSCIFCAF